MTIDTKPQLIVPIEASHVQRALALARPDIEVFRHDEMEWIKENNPYFRHIAGTSYADIINKRGKLMGDMSLAGAALGHRAVRLCTGEGETYDLVRKNYAKNIQADKIRIHSVIGTPYATPWNTETVLMKTFGDPELTAAILDIKSDMSRDTAAITIGTFCLAQMPDLVIPQ